MPTIIPGKPTEVSNTGQSPAQQEARARAIARLTSNAPQAPIAEQSQATPVLNPNTVAPEEMSAIAPSKGTEALAKAIKEEESTPESEPAEGQTIKAEGDAASESLESDKAAEVPPAKEDPLSTQYAVLARKEKALRAKVQSQDAAIKARETALAEREAQIKAKEAEYESGYVSKDKLAKDPYNTLQELGISYDQLTEMALNQPQMDPAVRAHIQRLEQKLEAEIKAAREQTEKVTKGYEDNQKQAYQQALNQIRTEAKSLVESDPNFETIAATNSVDDVVELIEETFKADGVLLSVEEAAQAVEAHLEEEALKLARLKKIQAKLQPAPTKTVEKQAEAKTESKQPQMKTLTNQIAATRPLTARERAILAMKGELKK